MKQKDVVTGKPYILVRMQHPPRNRPDLNGVTVVVTKTQCRSKRSVNWAGFQTGKSERTNNRYETSIGVRVGATNLSPTVTEEAGG